MYSPTYAYQNGYVYSNGAVQSQQVSLQSRDTTEPDKSNNRLLVVTSCATTTTCGTVTVSNSGSPTTNCASSTSCGQSVIGVDDWSGGGISWGGGGGGSTGTNGNSPAPDFPTGISNANVPALQTPPTLGNYAATLNLRRGAYKVINVTVEIDRNAHDIKKVVVMLNGATWLNEITQIGDGVMTGYNSATDTYSFQVTFQNTVWGVWSTQTTIYGTISPSQGQGTLTIP